MKWWRVTAVIVGALVITALGIDASDTLSGKGGTLLSQVIQTKSKCGDGMIEVEAVPGITCVDQFEVSPGDDCPIATPSSMIESQKNAETIECRAVSTQGEIPWSYVNRDQAAKLCARSGKRLPTAGEWYALTVGMADVERSCNVRSQVVEETGTRSSCSTPNGVHDLVGNLWEWVSDDVYDGKYDGRPLPPSGYIEAVDSSGVAVKTNTGEQEFYGNDYFWSSDAGFFGMIRGGFYGSEDDAGVYAIHADTPTNAANIGIGFRCVK